MNRSFRTDDNSSNSFIPSYSGTNGAVATHSNLSSMTAYSILNDDKGNAFDAAAGAMLVEGLVNPQMFGMGGEGVMILKPNGQICQTKRKQFGNIRDICKTISPQFRQWMIMLEEF